MKECFYCHKERRLWIGSEILSRLEGTPSTTPNKLLLVTSIEAMPAWFFLAQGNLQIQFYIMNSIIFSYIMAHLEMNEVRTHKVSGDRH
jgi:hypothetical protein